MKKLERVLKCAFIRLSLLSNIFFVKKDGSAMVLPHYYAVYEAGEIVLNEEYSEYQWVALEGIKDFEPKIFTIPDILEKLAVLKDAVLKTESVVI